MSRKERPYGNKLGEKLNSHAPERRTETSSSYSRVAELRRVVGNRALQRATTESRVIQRADVYLKAPSPLADNVLAHMGKTAGTVDDLDQLKAGDTLYIIGHDYQFGTGGDLIKDLSTNMSMERYVVKMIVCGAAAVAVGQVHSLGQKVANALKRPVWASTGIVTATPAAGNQVDIAGDFVLIRPGDSSQMDTGD